MKLVLSSGHGLHIRGARGNPVPPQLDEVDSARRVVDRVAELLKAAGVGCLAFHDNASHDQNTNLNTIVNFHNKQTRDLDCSVHFNAFDHTANGVEVLYVTQKDLAAKVSSAIAKAGGFTNRGAKKRTDLFFLNNTSKPAVLLETCFCDHTGDSNKFNAKFEAICKAIAESLGGKKVPDAPPPKPEPGPPQPHPPTDVPLEDRETVALGDEGPDVRDMQKLIPHFSGEVDGDFGTATETELIAYQVSRGLEPDGICGPITWQALYEGKAPTPRPPHALSVREVKAICDIAKASAIADYGWEDRGEAPIGYTQGMACAFAQSYRKLKQRHPAAIEMAKARTSSDKDALQIYRSQFESLDMSNETAGADTLRHLYALMIGSGMRESSGRHCEGRDLSAENVQSDTAEAGLFQTSYNAHSASDPEFVNLMAEYSNPVNQATCYLSEFEDGVGCTDSEWESYGSGDGYKFQELCKKCPAFAVETHGLTLRNLCNHYGPIIRMEVELRKEADAMLKAVQDYIDGISAIA